MTKTNINLRDFCDENSLIFNHYNETCHHIEIAGEDLKKIKHIIVDDSRHISLVLFNPQFDDNIDILVEENSNLELKVLITENVSAANMSISVKQDGEFHGYLVDFCDENLNFKAYIKLTGRRSVGTWKMAALSSLNNEKEFDINIDHLNVETNGFVDNYGVCKDHSKLQFLGTSYIANDAHLTKTIQNAKIMVLGNDANGIAKPILKIDHNDVQASHSASIGQMNEEHLFYLMSRGLTIDQAEQLIILGYFNPIIRAFTNTSLDDEIKKLMERRI